MARYTSLTEAITLSKRTDGSYVIPIEAYYDRFITKLDPSYAVSVPSRVRNKRGLCPFHDDKAPSLGILLSDDGRERFNCFGCREWGHVVDMHRKVELRYHSRKFSPDDAARDLLRLFDIDEGIFTPHIRDTRAQLTQEEKLSKEARRRIATEEILNRFDVENYRGLVLSGVSTGKGTGYFNSILHRMTSETKDPLEDAINRGEEETEDAY